MGKYTEFGKRMKEYESVPKIRLTRRTPVIIRLDGKAFHSFTRGFDKPFDDVLIKAMQDTMKYLCRNIQGCVLGYTQSDEISLLLIDYQTINTSAWFDNQVQKICSISASLATYFFQKHFRYRCEEAKDVKRGIWEAHMSAINTKMPLFDSRCFNLPKEEVTNYFYWRQQDATRNSIQMVGQAYFSQSQLHCKNTDQIQEMLYQTQGINWNDFPTVKKRGSCCTKQDIRVVFTSNTGEKTVVMPGRKMWVIDEDIPIFTGEGRDYIERLVHIGE